MNKQDIDNTSIDSWKGVTIDELKFMRAAALIRLEFQKEILKKKAAATLPSRLSSSGLVSDMASKMSFAQKVMLAFKGVKLASSIISFFRKSKNS